jgi:subfamily B ATP-binding cassette protein HlyB/CyaB
MLLQRKKTTHTGGRIVAAVEAVEGGWQAEADGGLAALALLARLHGVSSSPQVLAHEYPAPLTPTLRAGQRRLIRAAKSLGLKAGVVSTGWERLAHTPLPALAQSLDDGWWLLAKAGPDSVLVQHPSEPRPQVLPRAEFEARWSGRLLLAAPRTANPAGAAFGLAWFTPLLWKYRRIFGEVLLASFFLQLFALVSPLFFQVVVDKVLAHGALSTLDVIFAGLLGIALFEAVLGGLRAWLFAHTAQRVDVELGARLFARLLDLPLAWFEARRTGDSVARVRELETLRQFFSGAAVTLLLDGFFALAFLGVLYYYSPGLTLLVFLSLPIYALISLASAGPLRARLHEKFNRGAENQALLVESVSGIETVKSLAFEPRLRQRFENQMAAYARASFSASQTGNLAQQAVGLVSKAVTALLLWQGAHQVLAAELSVGALIAFNMIAGRVSGPILRLSQLWQDFQQAGISLRRLADILDTPPEQAAASPGGQPPALRGGIEFDQVSFRYQPGAPPVLREFSLSIAPGEVIGITGPSGSGKSTLAKLAQRLYLPESGRVRLDGRDAAHLNPAWLRRSTGVVPQEGFLFSGSVRHNIAARDPGMPLERITHAAQLAGAHGFIQNLPQGYDTPLGEHGTGLSGGQKQRLALARALAHDPRLLILDEATSALDAESEAAILHNMAAICRGRTVLIISHRLSALACCQRVLVLDQGRIVEQGAPAALLQAKGRYAALWRAQQGGAI